MLQCGFVGPWEQSPLENSEQSSLGSLEKIAVCSRMMCTTSLSPLNEV